MAAKKTQTTDVMTEVPPSAGSVSADADALLAREDEFSPNEDGAAFEGLPAKAWRQLGGPIPHLDTGSVGIGERITSGSCTGGAVTAIYVTTLGVVIVVEMPNGDETEIVAIGPGSAVLA